MKLQQLNEEHEAIKVHTYSRENKVSDSMGRFTIRLGLMPTELEFTGEDQEGVFSRFRTALEPLEAQLKQVADLKGLDFYKEFREELIKDMYANPAEKAITNKLQAEIDRITDHVTTLLKAKLMAYVHDIKLCHEQQDAEVMKKAKARLHRELNNS
jgi:hypothetical protein